MIGAHCLYCLEQGPDLIVDDPLLGLPVGTRGVITFTCGRCGRRWQWTWTMTADGVVFSVEIPPQLIESARTL